MNQYILGQSVNLRATFKTGGSVLVTPSTVVFKLKDPSQTVTTYTFPADPEIVNESVGVFKYQAYLNKFGIWTYRFEGTGAGPGATEATLEVLASQF